MRTSQQPHSSNWVQISVHMVAFVALGRVLGWLLGVRFAVWCLQFELERLRDKEAADGRGFIY